MYKKTQKTWLQYIMLCIYEVMLTWLILSTKTLEIQEEKCGSKAKKLVTACTGNILKTVAGGKNDSKNELLNNIEEVNY